MIKQAAPSVCVLHDWTVYTNCATQCVYAYGSIWMHIMHGSVRGDACIAAWKEEANYTQRLS